MSEKEKKKREYRGISRREFLKDAGIIAGGAAIGTTVLLAACKGGTTTETVTTTATVPGTTQTVTTTLPGNTQTVTSTLPGQTQTVTTTTTAEVPGAAPEGLVTLSVNGKDYQITGVKPNWTLAFVLREKLGLPGTKVSCNRGTCGTCTVIVDGRPVYSCMLLAAEVEGKAVTTIEGLSDGITLHPVQQAFLDHDAIQCGYCTPGFIMSTKALLDKKPNPTSDELREALSGHICICGTTKRVIEAFL